MGRAWKFGDDIDTDAIIPARFLTIYDPKELASHAFEGTRSEFAAEAKDGDVIVAGRNFGCGSSREHAPARTERSRHRICGCEIVCEDLLPECDKYLRFTAGLSGYGQDCRRI